ncbi:hypothetical protein Asphe3_35880 [Pseudarthrobacter phenanthrenivorans Sphe3]|uniref:Uncharacterized protein n=1 Tax=Pseudarthrobacter phenanthrenivorans (strain DSM 18606 / JCM 16027 / LMG 23796 / Sphe3) TaxID=930171 RepID=F0M633_PSEPM|nr:hypothetical protein Asphe3_35880 [Pseudarthrobacter phenanthrenivorans Sphe3]
MPSEQPAAERREITVRRAPKYVPFLILGALVGIAAAAVMAYGVPENPSFDAGAVFGFFMVAFAAGGAILGAVVALVLTAGASSGSRRPLWKPSRIPNRTRIRSRSPAAGKRSQTGGRKSPTPCREIIDQWHAAMENFPMIFSLAKKARRTLVASSESGHQVKK